MRFTIRDVLLAMVIVGLAVAWWLDHRQLAEQAANAQTWEGRANILAAQIREDGGYVSWTSNTITGVGAKGRAWSATWP